MDSCVSDSEESFARMASSVNPEPPAIAAVNHSWELPHKVLVIDDVADAVAIRYTDVKDAVTQSMSTSCL
jgi:hypothetical protein